MELINHCERLNKTEESLTRCILQNLFSTNNRDYKPFLAFSLCEQITDKKEARKCIDNVMISWLKDRDYNDTAYALEKILRKVE